MPDQLILRTVEFKLYLNSEQEETLTQWLKTSCWIYNRALEQRIKAYKRREESVTLYDQQLLLTKLRKRVEQIRLVPLRFTRDAIRRIDRAFKAFFRRCKIGKGKLGFPRFKSYRRYDSMECLEEDFYIRGEEIFIPKIGLVRCRGVDQDTSGKQKLLRVIRRASGWYAQILFERPVTPLSPPEEIVGIDVGLESFATLSNGEQIENPRLYRKSERKLRSIQRRASRKKNGSANRRKAVDRLRRVHERIAAQRKDFAHQESRKIVNRFKVIGFEKLNVKGLTHTKLAKSIMDAAWGRFLYFLSYKAEEAGTIAIGIDPRGTSQECPDCGAVKKKELSERIHDCPCGLRCHRDHAAARVIERRTLVASRREVSPVEGSTATAEHEFGGMLAR